MNSKERPIIFNTEMIRALLEGRKVQTRRLIKGNDLNLIGFQPETAKRSIDLCRYGKVGDILWVREKIYCFDGNTLPKQEPPGFDGNLTNYGCEFASVANEDLNPTKIISPIYMPRWCCGIELELIEVSIDRVTNISKEDAIAEGLFKKPDLGDVNLYSYGESLGEYFDPIAAFGALWNGINTTPGTKFSDNPWVWVLKFDVQTNAKDDI